MVQLRSVAVTRCCLHHWTLPAHLGMTCFKNSCCTQGQSLIKEGGLCCFSFSRRCCMKRCPKIQKTADQKHSKARTQLSWKMKTIVGMLDSPEVQHTSYNLYSNHITRRCVRLQPLPRPCLPGFLPACHLWRDEWHRTTAGRCRPQWWPMGSPIKISRYQYQCRKRRWQKFQK